LIHDYLGVDLTAVWEVTQKELPELREIIEKIIRDLDKKNAP
jgi:uncharacterized protein with HEPN domain